MFSEVTFGSLINSGYMKMPAKVGSTKNEPKKYHGVLFPHLVVILSLARPTMGVIIPSASCPDSKHDPATYELRPITCLRYNRK